MAVIRLASSPDSPTASAPWTLIGCTMSRLTLPTSTMRTISRVSASVTRKPSWNSGTLPTRSISAPIWGPPPWTTTGSMPTERMSTTSSANEASASASSTAGLAGLGTEHVAAVLDHDDLAPEPPDVGQGLDQHRGLVSGVTLARGAPGAVPSGTHDVVRFSSM